MSSYGLTVISRDRLVDYGSRFTSSWVVVSEIGQQFGKAAGRLRPRRGPIGVEPGDTGGAPSGVFGVLGALVAVH